MPPFQKYPVSHVSSTQNIAMNLVRERGMLSDGLVVIAESQGEGRGRLPGRQWVSPTGNLYMTAILHHGSDMRNVPQIPLVIAVSIIQALSSFVPPDILKIKWPNDIYAHNRKLSGILVEVEEDFLLIGVGFNILSAPEFAISLKDICDTPLSKDNVEDAILVSLWEKIEHWKTCGFVQIQKEWQTHAYGLLNRIQVTIDGQPVSGVFMGINGDGALVLQEANNPNNTHIIRSTEQVAFG